MMTDANDRVAFGSALTRADDVEVWRAGALLECGDPSDPVCQMFFHFQADLVRYDGEALACGYTRDDLLVLLGATASPLPVPVRCGDPVIAPTGELDAFGLSPITGDVWALSPSLNLPGVLHGFVVLYGVPTPAPWESRILLP
jgi:hypothetical protein